MQKISIAVHIFTNSAQMNIYIGNNENKIFEAAWIMDFQKLTFISQSVCVFHTKICEVVDLFADLDTVVTIVQWARHVVLFTVVVQNLPWFGSVSPLVHPRSVMHKYQCQSLVFVKYCLPLQPWNKHDFLIELSSRNFHY